MFSYKQQFQIADVFLELQTEHQLEITEAFEHFLVRVKNGVVGEKERYVIQAKEVDKLYFPEAQCVYKEKPFAIYRMSDKSFYRIYRLDSGKHEPYAITYYCYGEKELKVEYIKNAKERFLNTQRLFRHIPWEWILLQEKKILLHASCVKTTFGGIIFSGPSGIGKSTQGDLWCRYGNGRLINGDRTVICKNKEKWRGYGSPYAGSSRCYVDDYSDIKGIFFLKQGKTCELKLLSISERFKRIYSGLTVNGWDSGYVEMACDLVGELSMEIPAYEFTCTPDEEAVAFLKRRIEEGLV